mgnify:CR=1 FL=1
MDNLITHGELMSKKKENNLITLHFNGEEYKFELESLSLEGKAHYNRANEVAAELLRFKQQVAEKEWLASKYLSLVAEELKDKEEDKK